MAGKQGFLAGNRVEADSTGPPGFGELGRTLPGHDPQRVRRTSDSPTRLGCSGVQETYPYYPADPEVSRPGSLPQRRGDNSSPHGPSPGRLLPPQRSDNVVGGHRPHNSRIVKARRGSMLIVLPQPIRANPVMYNMYDTCAVTTAVTRIIRGSHHLVSYV